MNGGVCSVISNTQYTCSCPTNYYGTNCATFNACASTNCQNGGYCVAGSNNLPYCVCPNGYQGNLCQSCNF